MLVCVWMGGAIMLNPSSNGPRMTAQTLVNGPQKSHSVNKHRHQRALVSDQEKQIRSSEETQNSSLSSSLMFTLVGRKWGNAMTATTTEDGTIQENSQEVCSWVGLGPSRTFALRQVDSLAQSQRFWWVHHLLTCLSEIRKVWRELKSSSYGKIIDLQKSFTSGDLSKTESTTSNYCRLLCC